MSESEWYAIGLASLVEAREPYCLDKGGPTVHYHSLCMCWSLDGTTNPMQDSHAKYTVFGYWLWGVEPRISLQGQ